MKTRANKFAKSRRAFTLIELVVSLAMFTIIAAALQSALVLATKAIPDSKSANGKQLDSARAADRIISELTYALSVTEMTSRAVTFTVADRDGDGAPETIRYAWSGVAGDPLTRQYNSGTAASILDDVREFSLGYDKRSTKNAVSYTESAESLLFSFTGGLLAATNTIDKDGDWFGQYFVPSLPSNTVYWRVTHVRFEAQKHSGNNGETRVQVRGATSNGLPTANVLAQAALMENTLDGSWSWVDSYFTGSATLSPSSNACIVFRWVSDNESCDVLSKTTLSALGNGAKTVSTSNSGSSWSSNILAGMPIYIYGTTATQNADSYTYNLLGMRAVVRTGTNAVARASVAAQMLSQPQVTGP